MAVSGDIFKNCLIYDQNDLYFFLSIKYSVQDKTNKKIELGQWFDIVMHKDECSPRIKVGSKLDVEVLYICIANDGTPGAFVRPVLEIKRST
jgi:hypothetical protein